MTRPLLYGSANLMRTLHLLMPSNIVSVQFQLTVLRSTDQLHFSTITSISKAHRRCCGAVRASKLHLPRSCCTDSVIVAKDGKYGNKQVISITPQLYDYMLANIREPEILRELREETASMRGSQMQVSPDQAQLLAMLVQILGAQRCIEVGVYTGYSSLAIALVLPESGRLVACERDAKSLEIAKRYYERAKVSHKVDVRHALAADTLSYDFAFVDAEKRMYHEYFELLLQLVRVGGVIVVDNVLWHGKVADPLVNDPKTLSIREFNKNIMEDSRVSISMVPIGDGMTICCKR
ncbi:O-methyltransferase MdmC-like isoform X2 [Macadamia integrifolia]|uniref:O-methyltransferase MdmC-like isoform X2 n=1 Tax=Macadamia integrifolia TaxID=60698 RepID=UPI001C533F46|nr:O-methyltransferase MdmC-like isoform X2 [Macadamia integrifolia]